MMAPENDTFDYIFSSATFTNSTGINNLQNTDLTAHVHIFRKILYNFENQRKKSSEQKV